MGEATPPLFPSPMSTFLERIESLVGSTTGIVSTTLVTQFLQDAAKEIINTLPPTELYIVGTELTDSGSGASITGARFLYATKSGRMAKETSAAMKASLSDNDSIYKATNFSPACYREGNKVYILGDTAGGSAWAVSYPAVAYGDSTITNYPKELESLVALRAAIDCRQSQITYFRANSFPSAPNVSPLVIGAVAPTAPSAPSISYTDALPSTIWPSPSTFGVLPTVPTYTPPVSGADYTALDSAYTLEDSELAAIQLQKVSNKLNEYQTNISNSVNSFNKEVTSFQANMTSKQLDMQAQIQWYQQNYDKETDLNLQNEIQTLQAAVQQYSASLSKYQAEVQSYAAQVNKAVSAYESSLKGTIEAFNASFQMALQKLQMMLQELVVLKSQYTFSLGTYVAKGLPTTKENGKQS